MSICGKNVDTLWACKRSNRDFFPPIYRNTYILSYPVFLYYAGSPKVPPRVFGPLGPKHGALRCLLGFLALWGQNTEEAKTRRISIYLLLSNLHFILHVVDLSFCKTLMFLYKFQIHYERKHFCLVLFSMFCLQNEKFL